MSHQVRYCPLCDRTWPNEVCPEHQVPLLDPELVPPPEDAVLPAGTVIGERYVISHSIGQGGMGRVYAAEQRNLSRLVALKVLLPDLARGRTNLRRFYREARALSALTHPNIVQVFDFGVDRVSGLPFIAMELIDGETLAARLRRVHSLSEHEAARVCAEVADALVEAHEKGVVHRDLKPDNVFLQRLGDGSERAKVLDFGIARLLEPGSDGGQVTNTGAILGTPEFMSPEQATGQRVSARSDLYSLGCIFHTALVGRPPFSGVGRVATLVSHASAARPRLPTALPTGGVPPSACARALHTALLQIASDLRPADAAAVKRAFVRIAASTHQPESDTGTALQPAPVVLHEAEPGPTDDLELGLPDMATHPDALGPHDVIAPVAAPRRRWAAVLAAAGAIGAVGIGVAAAILVSDPPTPVPTAEPDPEAASAGGPALRSRRWSHYTSRVTYDVKGARGPSLRSIGANDYELAMSNGDDILVQRNGAVLDLTRGEVAGANDPVFSHDRRRIAFSADDGTYVMNADGSERRRVSPFGYTPAWSPDDQHLVVAELPVPDPSLVPQHDGQLHIITVATGESRVLATPPGAIQPDWSPDGRFIACAIDWRVWMVPTDGKTPPHRLEEGGWTEAAGWRPRFVPGSDALLTITYRNGVSAIYRYELEPESGRAASVEPLVLGLEGIVDLTVHSPGHAAFATREARPQTEIVALGPEGTAGERTIFARAERIGAPAFDSSGKRLITVMLGTDERVYFTDLSTSESSSPIDSEAEYAWAGRTSPDGRWLSFYGVIEGDDFGIWLGPLEGPFSLVVPGHYLGEWAPDSLHMSVVGRDTRPRLVALDPANPTAPGKLDPDRIGPRWHVFTAFSQDGERLAEVDFLRGGVWVRERDSFVARKVFDGGKQALWFDRRLLIADRHAVLLLDPESGQRRVVLDLGERVLPPLLPLGLSPDRTRMVVASEAPSRAIFDLSYRVVPGLPGFTD